MPAVAAVQGKSRSAPAVVVEDAEKKAPILLVLAYAASLAAYVLDILAYSADAFVFSAIDEDEEKDATGFDFFER
jgi:hypothetical protein